MSVALRHAVPICDGSVAPTVFCAHASAGTVSDYLDIARAMPAGRRFVAFESAGLPGTALEHEAPLRSVPAMARAYLTEATAIQAEGPYLFAGWSMGCYVALEMAIQAKQSGRDVGCLILIAPPTEGSRGWRDRRQSRRTEHRVAELTAQLHRLGDTDSSARSDNSDLLPFWDLDDNPFAHAPDHAAVTTADVVRLRLERVCAANIAAGAAYRPGRRFTGRCVVVLPADEPSPQRDAAYSRWRRMLTNPPEAVTLAGSHQHLVRGEAGLEIGGLLEAQAAQISGQTLPHPLESNQGR